MIESIDATSAGFAAGVAGAVVCACGLGDGAGDGFSFWPMAILVEQVIATKRIDAADNSFKAVAPVKQNGELILEHNPDTSKVTAGSIDTLLPGHI
jgi:hypothetical protein